MSEYTAVEQPFLHQLQGLGWDIIDQGPGIPADRGKTLGPTDADINAIIEAGVFTIQG